MVTCGTGIPLLHVHLQEEHGYSKFARHPSHDDIALRSCTSSTESISRRAAGRDPDRLDTGYRTYPPRSQKVHQGGVQGAHWHLGGHTGWGHGG